MGISSERWATGGILENHGWGCLNPNRSRRKPHARSPLPPPTSLSALTCRAPTKSQRGSAPAVSSLGDCLLQALLFLQKVMPLHRAQEPFLLPSCPQQIHAVFLSLLITARRKADGPAFIDTITARSSSLHCLEACLYLSLNPFCHF